MRSCDVYIRSFLKIAEAQSVSGAAEALDLSQSAVSKHLSLLEEQIGQPLFRRHGRGVALMPAGNKLYLTASAAYGSVDQLLAQLNTVEGVTEGTLRIASVHTLSTYFIPVLLSRLLAQRPKVNISLLCRSSPEVVELVESDKADVGFVYDVAVTSDGIAVTRLFSEKMVLVYRPGTVEVKTPFDMTKTSLPLVCFPTTYALRAMLQRPDIAFNVIAEVDTADAMLNLVHDGVGCCVLPDSMRHDLIEDRGLARVPIATPRLDRLVVAAVKTGQARPPFVDLALEIASTVVPKPSCPDR